MGNKKAVNEALRSIGFQPQYYEYEPDIYYDKNGNFAHATLRCACKGKFYHTETPIDNSQCKRCNEKYRYAKRRIYI